MAGSNRERWLMTVVGIAILFWGGSYAYRSFGSDIWIKPEDIDQRREAIETLLAKQEQSFAIEKLHKAMIVELQVEGEDSEQLLNVREDISGILREAGLEGKYRSITPKDPEKKDDFKILSFSIDNIECTTKQLGELLYIIEKRSNVMEVKKCDIENMVRENGKLSYGRRTRVQNATAPLSGMLTVDLEISRLVEYRKGEKPKKKRSRRKRS